MAEKAAEKKAPAKKTAEKKETAVKKPAAKKAPAKTAAKKAPAAKKPAEAVKAAEQTAAAAEKAPAAKKAAAKKPAKKSAPEIRTILQINGRDYDISGIAEAELKRYKSVHKRKNVEKFVMYVKPEEDAAYFTINGEGGDDFKIALTVVSE